MRVRARDAPGWECVELATVVEQVHRVTVEMPTLDYDGLRAHLNYFYRGLSCVAAAPHLLTRQDLGLGDVWCNQECEW